MDQYFSGLPPYSWTIISIMAVTLLFLIYHFLSENNYVKKSLVKGTGNSRFIISRRLLGLVLFGIIPLFLLMGFHAKPINSFGLTLDNLSYSLLWILGLTPVILLMNFFNAPKKDNLLMYPQIREKLWSKSLLIASSASWIAYLTGYEFMFRGFLLFSCFYALDAPSAIAINVCIYSLVHLPKGMKETLGAIPLGLLLSYLTLESNSILIALVVHIIMALSNEWFSIRSNPEIKVKLTK